MNGLADLDVRLFYLINHGWANDFLDAVFPWVTRLDNFWPFIAVVVVGLAIFGGRRGRWCLLAVAITIALSDPVTVRVLKPAFDRIRPCIAFDDVRLLASSKASLSFPSAHAVNAFAAMIVFARFFPRSIWVGIPLAVAIALSRVYIGVHYPSDILIGALVGGTVGWGVASLVAALAASVERRRQSLSVDNSRSMRARSPST